MTDEPIRETEIEALRRTVGGVLFNVSNFPDKAQARLLGQDMGPLNDRLTTAIIESWLPSVVARARKEAIEEVLLACDENRVIMKTVHRGYTVEDFSDPLVRVAVIRALAEGEADD